MDDIVMFCISLCDFFDNRTLYDDVLKQYMKYVSAENKKSIERVYFGAYFCSQYFIRFQGYNELFECCRSDDIKMTLVLPVFNQNTLELGKKRIRQICNDGGELIDEITINDIGMLRYIADEYKEYKINLGRLFFKNPRDCRIPEYTLGSVTPALLTHLQNDFWTHYNIECIELEPTNESLDISALKDDKRKIAMHRPFCYMTTGQICKFASIHKAADKKFRAGASCRMECLHIKESYFGHIKQTNCTPLIEKYGKTLFFKNNSVNINGKEMSRTIYFSVEEWRRFMYENTRTR